jgi:hypothetical protein
MPQDILHDCPLSGIELMVLVRRLKKARASEGGLGPTEDALLHRFERLLPPKLRPIEPPPTEELPLNHTDPKFWDV